MKKTISILLVVVMISMLSVLFIGCNSSSRIVGRWEVDELHRPSDVSPWMWPMFGRHNQWEFFQNGEVHGYSNDHTTWSIEGNRIMFHVMMMPVRVYYFSLSGSTLTIYGLVRNYDRGIVFNRI